MGVVYHETNANRCTVHEFFQEQHSQLVSKMMLILSHCAIFKTQSTCPQTVTYSGEVCREEFISLQACFSAETSPLNIPSQTDQQTAETEVGSLLSGFATLNPSPECAVALTPFLCLFIFGLCDSSNRLRTIVREECLELRDNICATEWSIAIQLLGNGVLPVCEVLPEISNECILGRFAKLPCSPAC